MKNKKIVAQSILGISALSIMLFPVGKVDALKYITEKNAKCTETEEYKAWAKLSKKDKAKTIEPTRCYEVVQAASKVVKNKKNNNLRGNYPANYDLRTSGYVTPVKNQVMSNGKDSNSCWAYTTAAIVESNYLKNGGTALDLSERHMGFNMLKKLGDNTTNPYGYVGHTIDSYGTDSGGNYWQSGYYLITNRGPVLDNKVPITTINSTAANTINLKQDYNVDEAYYYISPTSSCSDEAIENIKALITQYGAVGAMMPGELGDYLSDDGSSYYYNGTGSAAHAITIIGWDDSYSKNNFKLTPSRNGAWVIKNTYPTLFSIGDDEGYHYTSYDDTLICDSIFAVNNVDNYKASNTYAHSKHGLNNTISFDTNAMLFEGKYTKNSANAEILKSVSVAGLPGDSVDIYFSNSDSFDTAIQLNNEGSPITFETLGYKTFDVPAEVNITSNNFYVYIVYHATSSYVEDGVTYYEYPAEQLELTNTTHPYYVSSSEIKSGVSYYYNGQSFIDTTTLADFKFYPLVTVSTDNMSYTVDAGDPTPTTEDVVDTNGGTFFVPVTVNNVELSDLAISIKNSSNVESKNKFTITQKTNGFDIAVKPGVTPAGTYTVKFSYGDVSSSKQFVVVQGVGDEDDPVLVSSITVTANNNATEVAVNGTLQMSAEVNPTNANNQLITWSSSDETIATVDQTGKVTGVKAGKVNIIATARDSSGVQGLKQITVVDINQEEGNGPTTPNNPDTPVTPSNPDEKENNPKTGITIPIVASIVVVITSIGAYIVNKKHDLLKHFK